MELPCDIQRVVHAVRHRTEPEWIRGRHFYVARNLTDGTESLEMISDWVACALRICDGSRSIEQVVQQLAHDIAGIDEDVREYAFVRLLEGIHADELIDLYRIPSEASVEEGDVLLEGGVCGP